MILSPTIKVACDVCDEEDEYDMTPLAGGGWDDRSLQSKLDRGGWRTEGHRHVCPSCVEDNEGPEE